MVAMNERRLGDRTLQGARRATRVRMSILSVAVGYATSTTGVMRRSSAGEGGEALFFYSVSESKLAGLRGQWQAGGIVGTTEQW